MVSRRVESKSTCTNVPVRKKMFLDCFLMIGFIWSSMQLTYASSDCQEQTLQFSDVPIN